MNHSYDSVTVANAFLRLARAAGKTITPMQLNKLVYIAYGFFAGNTGNPLIKDSIQAWKYGPVIPDLYHACKKYGRGVITDSLQRSIWDRLTSESEHLDATAEEVVRKVYEAYGDLSGVQLSNITHQTNTPWQMTYDGTMYKEIPHDLIEDYYKNLITK